MTVKRKSSFRRCTTGASPRRTSLSSCRCSSCVHHADVLSELDHYAIYPRVRVLEENWTYSFIKKHHSSSSLWSHVSLKQLTDGGNSKGFQINWNFLWAKIDMKDVDCRYILGCDIRRIFVKDIKINITLKNFWFLVGNSCICWNTVPLCLKNTSKTSHFNTDRCCFVTSLVTLHAVKLVTLNSVKLFQSVIISHQLKELRSSIKWIVFSFLDYANIFLSRYFNLCNTPTEFHNNWLWSSSS